MSEKENDDIKGRFTFMKWNSKYGSDAKFVVKDESTGKQSIFVPGRTQDLCWSRADLANDPSIKDWSDFGNESVDDLESIAF